MSWRIELLSRSHHRDNFDCGEEDLDQFLRRYARQNDAKDISRTYVLLDGDGLDIVGYYTICSASVSFQCLPDDIASKIPRYPIPTAHIGRLAVDHSRQGQKLGALLLVDALKRIRIAANTMGIYAVTVQALHSKAAGFYKAFGFQQFKDDQLHLFLPMATIRNL